jgi:hypothetical protein
MFGNRTYEPKIIGVFATNSLITVANTPTYIFVYFDEGIMLPNRSRPCLLRKEYFIRTG